jgi:hypothetical protein
MKDKFGCAPIGKIIFTNFEKEKEWDEMDPNVKAFVMKNLYESAKKMESEIAIEMLCHVINDLIKRIEVLENARN